MRMSKVDDLLAPVYGRVIPGLYSLATSRAAQRLSAGAPETVLEVGVGPGHILAAVAQKNPTAHTIGVDISKAMLRQSRRTLSKTGIDAHLIPKIIINVHPVSYKQVYFSCFRTIFFSWSINYLIICYRIFW